jgi:hypothetical protein
MKEIRFLGNGPYRRVTLVENESAQEQIGLKTFPARNAGVSESFFRGSSSWFG